LFIPRCDNADYSGNSIRILAQQDRVSVSIVIDLCFVFDQQTYAFSIAFLDTRKTHYMWVCAFLHMPTQTNIR